MKKIKEAEKKKRNKEIQRNGRGDKTNRKRVY